ncbi:MAG TPA: tetratricopeptide repeat protein [Flavobacterium sp.]|nr:tetratricopeptide repeat protein [Flavobacterium sp.]
MKLLYSILSLAFSFVAFPQQAEELNQQSLKLLRENKFDIAVPILRKAAEMGNAESQYNLGYTLSNGLGVSKDAVEAVKWYRKSSENGFNDGHYAMMMAYGNGEGINQDSKLGFEYALKCAANNDITCIWNVASCYASGNGVEPNNSKFRELILKLAKMENPENLAQSGYITSARLEIAGFYKTGKYGFPIDFYQSYLWYLIYNEFKVDFSILKQQEVITEINAIERLLFQPQKLNGAKADAEILLGRSLKEFENRYKTTL